MKKMSTLSLMTLGFCSVCSLVVNGQVLNEGFEVAVPPSGWTTANQIGVDFITGSVGHTGSASAYLDIFNVPDSTEKGSTDALITGTLNLSTATAPALTFYYAYQMYSDPATYTSMDELNVYASTDGGSTWNSLYNTSGSGMVTATPVFAASGFVPQSADWKLVTVDISSVASASSVQFKFEFKNDWENNFYIDDIMISGGTAINNINSSTAINVYPSPSTGPVNIDMAASNVGQTDITVYNMVGQLVEHVSQATSKRLKLNLDNQPNGSYFVTVKTENSTTTKKVIVCR